MVRLEDLCLEHGLEYWVEQTKRDIRLCLRRTDRKLGYHMKFPKGRLDKVLEELPGLVAHLERMTSLGIQFQGAQARSARNRKWIKPKPPVAADEH